MPVTAKDFKIYNSTPEYVRQLDQAFDYFRAKFPNADDTLRYLLDTGKQFMNNSPGNPYVAPKDAGSDAYGRMDGHDIILWNPATGILVTKDGKVTGIESAADGLGHEIWGHGLNPANDAMLNTPDSPEYQTLNERVAVGIESILNILAGEPQRDNHYGTEVWTSDVTVHTIMGENGELILVRTNANGQDEYGPQIDYKSAGWQQLQHAFDQADTADASNHGSTTIDGIVIHITGHRDDSGGSGSGNGDSNLGGGDWAQWNGEISEGGGGDHTKQGLEDKSSDDPDYQYPSHMMQIGNLIDTPANLTGGTVWLQHLGDLLGGGHPVLPQPAPMPIPDAPEVTLVGVTDIIDSVLA